MGQGMSGLLKKNVKSTKSKTSSGSNGTTINHVVYSDTISHGHSNCSSVLEVCNPPVVCAPTLAANSQPTNNSYYRTKRHQSTPAAFEKVSNLVYLATNNTTEKFPSNRRSGSMGTHNIRPRSIHGCNSIQHISERIPDITSASASGASGAFYSEFHESVGADEVVKVRRCMNGRGKHIAKSNTEHTLSQDGSTSSHTERNNKNRRGLKKEVTARLKGDGLQSNSCSTLFVDQTLSQPDLSQILSCPRYSASTAVHMSFKKVLGEECLPEFDPIFDEKKHPLTNQWVSPDYRTRLLSVMEIHDFLCAFFRAAVLKASNVIVTMVYITRLHSTGLVLQPANWKRVILGAVMLASKVWDDEAVWNADYCAVLPDVTVESMNQLERKVLERLVFNVSVSLCEYAQHYFDLRVYGFRADVCDGIQPARLTVSTANKLDAANSIQKEHPCAPIKRVASQANFVHSPPPAIIS